MRTNRQKIELGVIRNHQAQRTPKYRQVTGVINSMSSSMKNVKDKSKYSQLWTSGLCSNYIKSFRQLKSGTLVVLVCRVSSYKQNKNRNLQDQRNKLYGKVTSLGCIVVYEHLYVGSGWKPFLEPAVERAHKYGAVIVAESTDRFVRTRRYHSSKNPNARLSEWNLRILRETAEGVELYTVEDPDNAPGANRSAQIERGQQNKSKGGRPKKMWRQERAKQLKALGWSLRKIGFELNVSHETVRKWLNKLSTLN